MDEALELATYGDQFAALTEPAPDDLALITESGHTSYRCLVPHRDWPANTRVSLAGDLAQVLESTLAAWAVDGSVVLARNGQHAGGEPRPERRASERVTLDLSEDPGEGEQAPAPHRILDRDPGPAADRAGPRRPGA